MNSHPRKIENAGNTPMQKNKTMIPKEEICEKTVKRLLTCFRKCQNLQSKHANSSIAHPELALIMKMIRTAHRKDQKSQRHACEFFDRAPRAGIDTDNIAGLRRTSPTITPTTTITTTTYTDKRLTQTCAWHRRTLLLLLSFSLSLSLSLLLLSLLLS